MCRVFRNYIRYFMELGGQDLRQNLDFAAIINVEGQFYMYPGPHIFCTEEHHNLQNAERRSQI